jgi:fibronectin type 3 domain-containing protein
MNASPNRWRRVALILLALALLPNFACHRQTTGPHRVTLTWKAPPAVAGTTIVGYNIYRRPSDVASFVKIATGVKGPPYEDQLVASRKTYVYAVTSVDQAGRESRFSSVITATIP